MFAWEEYLHTIKKILTYFSHSLHLTNDFLLNTSILLHIDTYSTPTMLRRTFDPS